MFLLRPPPLSGESLSSWRQRAGEMNGFWRYPPAPGAARYMEPDRLRDDQEVRWLCDEFSIAEDELRCLTLEHRLRSLGITFQEATKLRWVLRLNPSQVGSSGRSMYCPLCLLEDEAPYFRLAWRFAFTTHCERHRCTLQEKCPTCGSPVWPASIQVNAPTAWLPLITCRICRSSLAQGFRLAHPATLDRGGTSSNIDGKSLDSLWYFAQLLLRARSRRLQKYIFERAHIDHAEIVTSCTIEHLPLGQRQAIITASAWLLHDWPTNFLSAAAACEISLGTFSGTLHLAPDCIQKVIRSRLVKRDRNKVTHESISKAIETIAAEGGSITKSAIRRALKVSESSLLNSMIAQRRRATTDEGRRLLLIIENACAHATDQRSHRSALQRDCFIFLLSMISGQRVERVCKATHASVKTILVTSSEVAVIEEARALAKGLYGEVIKSFASREHQIGSPFLLSRWGEPILGHSVRQRISAFMQIDFPEDLWRSVDVFSSLRC